MKKNRIHTHHKLGIVTFEPFPTGGAATNRIISYSKVLSQKNIDVTVYIARPSEIKPNIFNTTVNGDHEGIHFEYVNGYTVWPDHYSKIKKLYILISGYIALFKAINRDIPDSIILVSNVSYLMIYVWLCSKVIGFKYFQEKSEYPPVIKRKTGFLHKKFYLSIYKLFDGMILMTEELKNYFLSIGQKNVFHLPMSVDHDRFDLKKDKKILKPYFAYCGGGNFDRDGLYEIIQAFIDFYKECLVYEFYLIGDNSNSSPYMNKIKDLVNTSNLGNVIKFLGKKPSGEIPGLLINAQCLILAPQKDFDSGGFPTKLGEYLATSVPVISTRVSEIPKYLDSQSAILTEPGNHQALVNAMRRIHFENAECRKIGINGRKIARKYFSIETYASDLIKFLKSE